MRRLASIWKPPSSSRACNRRQSDESLYGRDSACSDQAARGCGVDAAEREHRKCCPPRKRCKTERSHGSTRRQAIARKHRGDEDSIASSVFGAAERGNIVDCARDQPRRLEAAKISRIGDPALRQVHAICADPFGQLRVSPDQQTQAARSCDFHETQGLFPCFRSSKGAIDQSGTGRQESCYAGRVRRAHRIGEEPHRWDRHVALPFRRLAPQVQRHAPQRFDLRAGSPYWT